MQKLLGSDAKVEILALFHRNPGLVDRMDGISERIGRSPTEIELDLKDLLGMGVLVTKTIGSLEVICFDPQKDTQIQTRISNLLRRGG